MIFPSSPKFCPLICNSYLSTSFSRKCVINAPTELASWVRNLIELYLLHSPLKVKVDQYPGEPKWIPSLERGPLSPTGAKFSKIWCEEGFHFQLGDKHSAVISGKCDMANASQITYSHNFQKFHDVVIIPDFSFFPLIPPQREQSISVIP